MRRDSGSEETATLNECSCDGEIGGCIVLTTIEDIFATFQMHDASGICAALLIENAGARIPAEEDVIHIQNAVGHVVKPWAVVADVDLISGNQRINLIDCAAHGHADAIGS